MLREIGQIHKGNITCFLHMWNLEKTHQSQRQAIKEKDK